MPLCCVRYETTDDILAEFYPLRLSFYAKRKEYMSTQLRRELVVLENKARFILAVVNRELELRNKKKAGSLFLA
jgi:DNA topoisomerase-2